MSRTDRRGAGRSRDRPSAAGADALRIGVGIAGLALVLALVGWITLSPEPVDGGREDSVRRLLDALHGWGAPPWFGYRELEFSANVALFAPIGLFAGLLLPLRLAWLGGVAGTGLSALIEAAQFALLPDRTPSLLDVAANGAGAWIGVGLAVLLRLGIGSRSVARSAAVAGSSATAAPR